MPINEKARLEALRALKILDTPPEERFDRITRLVQRTFGIMVATLASLLRDVPLPVGGSALSRA